ncbi:MAG: hypothetical protein QM756_11090 [Polyangiaceae bacterium]
MISPESVESEYNRFLVAMALDSRLDTTRMTEADARSYAETKLLLTNAMARGTLTINEQGEPVFAPQADAAPIVFHEATGGDLMAMDRARKGFDIEKQNLLLAAVTKEPRTRFEKMALRDYRVCVALLVLMVLS